MPGDLRSAIVASLPARMPGREVTAIAAELGYPVAIIQAELLAMEGQQALRKGRMGHQRWYRGPNATAEAEPPIGPTPDGLW